MTARRITSIVAVAIALGLAPGCEPKPVNRSPTPDQDAPRFARAVAESEEATRLNREAESRFYRRKRVPRTVQPLDDRALDYRTSLD